MDLKKLDDIKINFIIGPGRSGTTLLVVLLNNQSNCISTPEIHHFIFFYKKYKDIQSVSSELIEDFKNYLSDFFKYKKNPLIGPLNYSLIDELKVGEKINYGQFTKLIYLSLYGNKGITNEINVIADKNPYYTFHIDKIVNVFPNAKILALIRDYRAYTLSNLQSQKPWISIKSSFYYGCVWNLYLKKITEGKTKYGNSIMVVRYEDFVLNKTQSVKEILEFFDLIYSDSVFDFHLSMKQKITEMNMPTQYERMVKKINDLSLPINSDRIYSWEKDLSIKDLKYLDFTSTKLGVKYGYDKKTTLSFIEKCKFYIFLFPHYLRVKVYELINSPKIHFYLIYKNRSKIV